jgi:hypothetical protein
MASNRNRSRGKQLQLARIIIVDSNGNQFDLDINKVQIVDNTTNKPLFTEETN